MIQGGLLYRAGGSKPLEIKGFQKKNSRFFYQNLLSYLVEVGGVEPPSESALTETSPGADGYCGVPHTCFLHPRQAVTPRGQVASLCMVRSKLCARTDAANRRSTSGPQHSRSERAA